MMFQQRGLESGFGIHSTMKSKGNGNHLIYALYIILAGAAIISPILMIINGNFVYPWQKQQGIAKMANNDAPRYFADINENLRDSNEDTDLEDPIDSVDTLDDFYNQDSDSLMEKIRVKRDLRNPFVSFRGLFGRKVTPRSELKILYHELNDPDIVPRTTECNHPPVQHLPPQIWN